MAEREPGFWHVNKATLAAGAIVHVGVARGERIPTYVDAVEKDALAWIEALTDRARPAHAVRRVDAVFALENIDNATYYAIDRHEKTREVHSIYAVRARAPVQYAAWCVLDHLNRRGEHHARAAEVAAGYWDGMSGWRFVEVLAERYEVEPSPPIVPNDPYGLERLPGQSNHFHDRDAAIAKWPRP